MGISIEEIVSESLKEECAEFNRLLLNRLNELNIDISPDTKDDLKILHFQPNPGEFCIRKNVMYKGKCIMEYENRYIK